MRRFILELKDAEKKGYASKVRRYTESKDIDDATLERHVRRKEKTKESFEEDLDDDGDEEILIESRASE